ncbi:XRE family transcriptional regulator [Actinoplanes sp. NPDC051861]|uniref:helix-turn-helix domain-containing protein n=1 Tax=Actinoplanes sp. NPDC051861 TaxID=3155170 RepID=UPI0034293E3B
MGVGERIAEARSESGLTQAQLAAAVGLARSALAKVETGIRGVSALELVAIARELRRRVEWFVEPGPPAIVSYRASREGVATQAIDDALDKIVRDVDFVIREIPGLIQSQPDHESPPESMADAEELAARARSLLGLEPDEPALELSRRVTGVGLLPFAIPLGDGADAGTVLLRAGGVSVINGDLRVGRRRLALAHEFGHYLVADPYTTDWRVAATDADALEGRLDRFARALLIPEADLRSRWAEWTAAVDDTLRDVAVRAGSHYQVDMATLARRLTEVGMLDTTQANSIRAVQTKKADIVEKNLVIAHELEPISLPRPYEQAILKLYRHETVTADRACGLLLGTFDEEALPDRFPVSEAEIWTVMS